MRTLAAVALFAVACFDAPPPLPEATTPPTAVPVAAPHAAPEANPSVPASDPVVAAMQALPLDYTAHARCRMDCRHISPSDVEHVLARGVLDPDRSRTDGRCPSHALHAAPQGRDLRIVFAACADETRVVTAIDLDRSWDCDCP